MASLKEVKNRINSVQSTRKITSAMKLVASSKLHKAQASIESMLPYERQLNRMMSRFVSEMQGEVASSFVEQRKVNKVVVIPISSNSSLCGAFNANVIKKIVAIICGGDTSEHDVSMRSAQGIKSFIDSERYDTFLVEIHRGEWNALLDSGEGEATLRSVVDRNDFSFADATGSRIRPDFCYITIHGAPGENGVLQGYLDLIGMPYSTSGVLVEALTYDKFATNNYMRSLGVRVADSLVVRRGHDMEVSDDDILKRIGLPCFVKPSRGGRPRGYYRNR